MSQENYFPNEENTQTLNRMAADIQSLKSRMDEVEIQVAAQAKRTNADLLSAIADMFKSFAEEIKADIRAEFKAELKTELEPIKQSQARMEADIAELKIDVAQLKIDVAQLKIDIAELKERVTKVETELASFKLEVRDVSRAYRYGYADVIRAQGNLEERLEKLEPKPSATK